MPREHALAGVASIAFSDTLGMDHIGLHAFLRHVCNDLHRNIRLRIQVNSFEAACRMIEATVGVGVMPESAARRHAQTMAIAIVPLQDEWSLRAMHIRVRRLDALQAKGSFSVKGSTKAIAVVTLAGKPPASVRFDIK